MTNEVKRTNRASRKRVAENETVETETQTQAEPKPKEAEPDAPTARKDGREVRKMPSGATALV